MLTPAGGRTYRQRHGQSPPAADLALNLTASLAAGRALIIRSICSLTRSRARLIGGSLGLAIGGVIVMSGLNLAAAQSHVEVAKLLRVEWEAGSDKWGPPRLVGHIYNDSTYRIGSVRLRVEVLDGSNQVVRDVGLGLCQRTGEGPRVLFSAPPTR